MTHQESLTKVIEEIREEYPGMLILENEPGRSVPSPARETCFL